MKVTILHLVFFLTTAAAIAIPTKTAVATTSAQTPTAFNTTNIQPPKGGDQDHDQDIEKGDLKPWEHRFCSMRHHYRTKSAHHKMKHPAPPEEYTKGKKAPNWQRCKKHFEKHMPPMKMESLRSLADTNGTRASSAQGYEGHKGHKSHEDHGSCFKKCVGFKMPFLSKLIPEGVMEPICEGICGCKGSEQCKGKDTGGKETPPEESPPEESPPEESPPEKNHPENNLPVPYQGMNEMHGWKEWIAKEKEIEPAKGGRDISTRSVGEVSTAFV
ncbi:hypothetical protein BDP81DRAFT_503565 [Colletotrichum phormii]|uniref:Clock-controlled pheromone ccg-4 n=1 Tax=Colletotrichum phormii TaxID=359342 RepID=A0AAI9ZFK0_9PEZI|nr:uncharacterized protein BDP81DRAFT_503565 [Colletotrichum phormii]KAK1623362.1 hypothetical protein BDP81DRAFT_503565 [Colletotrichum phormii]